MHNDTLPVRAPGSPLANPAVAAGVCGVALVLALVSPRATPIALGLIGIAVIGLALFAGHLAAVRSLMVPLPDIALAIAPFTIYLFANALWAVDPSEGLSRALLFLAIVALVAALARAAAAASADATHRIVDAIWLAVLLATAFLCLEIVFDQPVRRLLATVFPALRPSAKHARVIDGVVQDIGLYTLNRNLGLLNMLLWPVLLAMRSRLSTRIGLLAGIGLLALAAMAMFGSHHETSMLAIVAASVVFVGMIYATRVTRAIVLASWVAALLLVVPLADIAHDAGLHRASWLPGTARNRIVLWNVTADKVREAPLLGIGIGSTKPLDEVSRDGATREAGDSYAQRTGRHAHNVFLQTWFELGAVGAILLLVAGIVALRKFARLEARAQPYVYASFVATMVIAAFSWGMWQPWFMAAFGLWAALLVLTLESDRRTP